MKNIAVKLTNVSKRYVTNRKDFHQKTFLFKFLKFGYSPTYFYALKDINLTIYQGEKIGIIGPNGSGKTTLLKLISGITTASSGSISTYGKIISLIDIEAGFHPDLTGKENILLNGILLKEQKQTLIRRMDSIVKFADLANFINEPLYTYSNGMKLRLGFSIAFHTDPDIFVLDEETNMGDKYFQKKIKSVFMQLMKKKKTIINVSHTLDFIQRNCDRIVLMNNGKIEKIGKKNLLNKYFTKI